MESRQARAVESRVVREVLGDPHLQAALQALCRVADRARGPHGHTQSLHNSVGGPISNTTSSARLLQALALSRPCLRLVASAVQGHLRSHRDGGLLALALCLRLVLNAVTLDNDVGRMRVREAYGAFFGMFDEYLNANKSCCPVVVSVDTSNLKVMLGYVQTIISSKPVCSLRPALASHVSQLVLKAFLTSVPDDPSSPSAKSFLSDRVYMLQADKTDVASSQVVEGLLLEWPEKCAQLGPQELPLLRERCSGCVKVALVDVSMSGDAEEIPGNEVEAESQVVLCQKVVHPKVRAALRQRGLLLLDRLGSQPMAYIQDLTGAVPISSVLVKPEDSVWGAVSAVDHRVLHGKSYLQLRKAHSCVCTLLLCAPMEQQLAELKCVVQSAMAGLWSTFQCPYLLCGGGCWQFHMSAYLRHEVQQRAGELCTGLALTRSQLQACAEAFCSSLESTATALLGSPPSSSFQAWVNPAGHRHVWHAPPGVDLTTEQAPFSCACGMVTSQRADRGRFQLYHPRESWGRCEGVWSDSVGTECLTICDGDVNYNWLVLDSMDCAVSAVRTAVATACTVLSFTQFIHDVN